MSITADKVPGYSKLEDVLNRAYQQAASGKGKERHAGALPFDKQPMQQLCNLYGRGFALGQAGKKMQEAQRMPRDAAVRELLGAIVYLAGAVIHLEAEPTAQTPANDNEQPHCAGALYRSDCCGNPNPSYCKGCPRV